MKNALVLVYRGDSKNAAMDRSDRRICSKLRGMGYSVVPRTVERGLEDDDEVGLLMISPRIQLGEMEGSWRDRLARLDTPVIVMDGHQFDEVYPETIARQVNVEVNEPVAFNRCGFPPEELTADHGAEPERIRLLMGRGDLHSTKPTAGATLFAYYKDQDHVLVFGHRAGTRFGQVTTTERRVALFFGADTANRLSRDGWRCVAYAINWAAGAKELDEVLKDEWNEIRTRRERWFENGKTGCQDGRPPANLVGLALSGGGIRSATFSLGVLQELNRLRLLGIFDYISTVSGGGFTGGWWSAWLSRCTTTLEKKDPPFPRDEMTEPQRLMGFPAKSATGRVFEGSLSSGDDPIHHLRLFSNYLTPRKGALSGDLWRAIAILSRNLVLTWLVLLPILFSFVLAGQLYFVLQKNSTQKFFGSYYSSLEEIDRQFNKTKEALDNRRLEININHNQQMIDLMDEGTVFDPGFTEKKDNKLKRQSDRLARVDTEMEAATLKKETEGREAAEVQSGRFNSRILQAAAVLLLPLSWFVVMTFAWMRSNVTKTPFLDWIAHTAGTIGVGVLIYHLYGLYHAFGHTGRSETSHRFLPDLRILTLVGIWAAISVFLWLYTWPRASMQGFHLREGSVSVFLWLRKWLRTWFRSPSETMEWRKELRRNKIESVQATLLVAGVVAAFVLALAGFGHDLASYLWFSPVPKQTIYGYIAKAGGWGAVILAVAGSIFTAIKNSPKSNTDKKEETTSKTAGLVLGITPPLVMIVLAMLLASFSHWILNEVNLAMGSGTDQLSRFLTPVMSTACTSIFLALFLAIYEMRHWREKWRWRKAPWHKRRRIQWIWVLAIYLAGAFVSAGITLGCWFRGENIREGWVIAAAILFALPVVYRLTLLPGRSLGSLAKAGLVLAVVVLAALVLAWARPDHLGSLLWWVWVIIGGLVFCFLISLGEVLIGNKHNSRSAWLLFSAYIALLGLLVLGFAINQDVPGHPVHTSMTLALVTLGLLATALGWTVAFGWMADPNLLSLHRFYRNRLVRAYMGASNQDRKTQEITEVAEKDDVLLSKLENCQKGAPYHLINTTLNLVGGGDLATAQRSSASFVLSARHCGSSRTGYRGTDSYMGGRLSVGTAVAVSGAAVSPSMGARTMSASISMLMTLLNVRLGFWAPTPNRANWQAPSARLWPFYTLHEFLSQTNDLSSYCCLTDGGHFDNTGLYSLVERGCQYILVVDNGADPRTSFQDLGDAIRRCRIDFGADVDLDITSLFRKPGEESPETLAASHFITGKIKYCKEHLTAIGWSAKEAENYTGIIMVIKPSVAQRPIGVGDAAAALTGSADSADVRQYSLSHADYPQQSTANQWFDEAQFESYRELGAISARAAFENDFYNKEVGKVRPFDPGQALTLEKIDRLFKNVVRI